VTRPSEAIHDSAAVGFGRAGADYERGRPGYPPGAVQLLARELQIGPGRRVVDLAAGTGKLTRALKPYRASIVAVEPVAGMREQLVSSVPGIEPLDGTAERIPLPDASVDTVLVAQAFHWFDAPRAVVEIHRILRPGGGLGVIWNSWDESIGWVARLQERVHRHVGDTPQQRSSPWRAELEASGLFTSSTEQVIPNLVRGELDALLARVSSVSYVASLEPTQRAALLADVQRIVAEAPETRRRHELEMPYLTHVVTARRR
jgi:SAM-dependent methyltransferase